MEPESAEVQTPKLARWKKWAKWLLVAFGLFIVAASAAFFYARRHFEPYVRDLVVEYLEKRFDSEVEFASLSVELPGLTELRAMARGQTVLLTARGSGLSIRHMGRTDVPPMFKLAKFSASMNLSTLRADTRVVPLVVLDGMEINLPPKGERPKLSGDKGKEKKEEPEPPASEESGEKKPPAVLFDQILIRDAMLQLLPRDPTRVPLKFDLYNIRLTSAGPGIPMNYEAFLTNPKPKGEIHSKGSFGPWNTKAPSDTPLSGDYLFENADLGVFNGIAGILKSTGRFEGELGSIIAKGEASVPDFRLKMAGNPVPLHTTFEVLVDGTNGNTVLKPVHAKLGSTNLTTSGGIVRHTGDTRKTIDLDAHIPAGNLRDVLKLAMKGPSPFMEGTLKLDTKIKIPPLSGKVKEKLELDGTFDINNGKFLKSQIQDKIDGLSRSAQGQPKNQEIDEVVSHMSGKFRLDDEILTFRQLAFAVAGAVVNLDGTFDMDKDTLNLHGALLLDAKVSQTQSGWKRWVLKPVDPFFAKNGVGTYLKIKIEGPAKQPKFGLDLKGKQK